MPLLFYSIISEYDHLLKKNRTISLIYLSFQFIFISATLSTIFSFNVSNSLPGYFYIAFGLSIFYRAMGIPHLKKIEIAKYISVFFGISILIFSLFIALSKNINLFERVFETSIGSFQVNSIGSMIAVCLPGVFSFYLIKPSKFKIPYITVILLSFFILYFTHSRSSILALFISLSFIITINLNMKYIKKYNWGLLIPVLFIVAIFGFFLAMNILKTNILTDSYSIKMRFSIWNYFVERTLHHSPFFGFGPDNETINSTFTLDYLNDNTRTKIVEYINFSKANPHAHNLLVEVIHQFGLLGFFFFLILIGSMLFSFYKTFSRKKRKSIVIIISGASLLSIFVQELFDYTLPDTISFVPVMIYSGFLASMHVKLKNKLPIEISYFFERALLIFIFPALLLFLIYSYNYKIFDLMLKELRPLLSIDNFNNYKFSDEPKLVESCLKKYEKWKSYYIQVPFFLFDKKEIVNGELYLDLYKKGFPIDINIPKENFSACISLYPRAASCYYRLSQIAEIKGDKELQEVYLKKTEELDPFKLLKKN